MTARWRGAAILAAVAAAAVVVTGACGKSRKSSGGGGGGGTPAVNEQVLNPYGFTIQVTGVNIPADPTAAATPPTVTFTVTDNGTPVNDLQQEIANAPPSRTAPPNGFPYIAAPRFTLARLDPAGYQSLYVSNAGQTGQAATSVTVPGDATAFGQRVTSNGNGSYTFKLDPLPANPTADERGRTFTVGTWASRQNSADEPRRAATSTLNFVPGGGTPTTRQVVSLAACNTCHGPAVTAHGTRLGTQLCLTCHTSQTHDAAGTSVEFVELIHKIHYGSDRAGSSTAPYTVGTTVFNDAWMNDVRNCTVCHQGANADQRFAAASLRNCATCHTIVNFAANSGLAPCTTDSKDTAPCSHPGGPQTDTSNCAQCHNATDLQQRHTSIFEIAKGWQYDIQSVTVGQDGKPVVRFAVRDTTQPNSPPRDLENDPSYKASASSLNVQIGWPSKEYTNDGTQPTTQAPGQPRSIPVIQRMALTAAVTKVAGQTGVYEVTSPVALPQGVTSATVFMDGHPFARGENIPVTSAVKTFGTDGGAGDARRQVVAVENCNKCHGVLSAHGRNRNGTTQVCVVCHNPKATDWQKRQGVTGVTGEQSVDFKVLIHGVHSADIRQDPMIVYGFNGANAATGGAPGTPNEFPGDIPHGVNNCTICHTDTTYEPPLPAESLDTVVDTNGTPLIQADDTTMPKTIAVCTACHDQVHFDQASSSLPACGSLATVNSKACFHSGGAQTGDAACASCHGKGGAADVQRVHNVQ